MSDNTESWDHSVDVLVVGSGNGAMTSALCCYEMGTKDVLVIEKGEQYGGTSSLSGGGIWVPNTHYAQEAIAEDSNFEADSFDAAKEYLNNTIPDVVKEEMIDTYLQEGPKMVKFLHDRTRVRYESLALYPDYYSSYGGARPGHRSLEPSPLMISELGDEWPKLMQTHHMMYLFDRIAFTQTEAHVLVSKSPGWIKLMLKLAWDYMIDIPWRLKSKRSRRTTNGCAGVARLRLSMLDRNMPLWLNTEMKKLITDDNNRVTGAEVVKDGKRMRIQAKQAVVLAAGGFEHNQAMREKYLPAPTNESWSSGVLTNTGDAHRAAMDIGADVAQMNGAWWCTTFSTPNEPLPRLAIMEKSLPGSCVVNKKGERIANESQNYMAYQLELFQRHSDENPCVPAWMVFDARFRKSYIVGPLLSGQEKPDFTIPKEWYDSGFLAKANSIAELSDVTGIDKKGLEETISKMNEYAVTGKDLDHQRGDSEYDRYYGDPTVTPNPCLAPIKDAPFYAIKIDPGDFGTQGGMVVNTDAQVLNEQGAVIEGLYATGNCTQAVLPTYPGPGSTLGPAMTFAYQAAKKITGYTA